MGKKISDIKVRLFILDHEKGSVLASQRDAVLNRSAETMDWNVYANSMFIESEEAYTALADLFAEEKSVNAYLQFVSGRKYAGSCTIKRFKSDTPYRDLAQYSLVFEGNGSLRADEGRTVIM